MAPTTETRIWRRIIRVTWAVAALAGVAVALIPSVPFLVVVAATLLAGAGAFAYMIETARTNGDSLRRPARIKQSRAATAIILVAAALFGALIGLSFAIVLVLDAPYGLVVPMGAALGGIGGEMLDRLALRLDRRTSKVSEPGAPTVGVG